MSKLFTLRESALFTWKASQLGSSQKMDDLLSGLLWAIARLADDFPLVEGTEHLRVAESKRFIREDGTPVRLRLWFALTSESEVDLLTIEAEEDWP